MNTRDYQWFCKQINSVLGLSTLGTDSLIPEIPHASPVTYKSFILGLSPSDLVHSFAGKNDRIP